MIRVLLALACIARAQAQPQPPNPAQIPPTAPAASPAMTTAQAPAAPPKPAEPPSGGFTIENSMSLRDPFRRPVSHLAAELGEGGNIPELERYDLDKFKLVAVITGPRKNKALVATPGGRMMIVAENMRIGTHRGLIKSIGPGTISVEEKVVNVLGQEESLETKIEFASQDAIKETDPDARMGPAPMPGAAAPAESAPQAQPGPRGGRFGPQRNMSRGQNGGT